MAQLQIRFPDDLMARISAAANQTHLSKNDVIRLCIEAGLKWMAHNNYNLTATADPQPLIDEIKRALEKLLNARDALLDYTHIQKPGTSRLNE